MSAPFDPYFKWLGIPPSDRPVDFYRLLGIPHFEDDPDVIANAADQRTGHVKNFLTGQHAKPAQRILNEIGAARVCLLNPETKAQYDKKLQTMPGLKQAGQQPPALPAQNAETAAAATAGAGGDCEESSSQWKTLAVALGIGVGLAAVLILLGMLLMPGGEGDVAQNEPPAAQPGDGSGQSSTSGPKQPKGKQTKPKDGQPKDPQPKDPAPKDPQPKQPAPENPQPKGPQPKAPQPEAPQPKAPQPKDPQPKDPPPKDPSPKPPAPKAPQTKPRPASGIFASKKLPVPGQEAQRRAEAEVREVFQLGDNMTKQQRLELADKLFASALETKDDPAARFVLLRMAAETVAKTGDVDRTFKMVDELGKLYEVSLLGIKVDALAESSKTAGSGPQAVPANMTVVRAAGILAEEALADDDYRVALRVLEQIALPAARRTGDKTLTAGITKSRRELKRLSDEFAVVEQALSSLKDDPDSGEANLTVGRWYCLEKGNWKKGLPFLGKGSDASLADPAKRDLAGPKQAASQAELADAWWKLSEDKDRKKDEVGQLRARALHWYRNALPGLSGLLKIKVQRQIEEAGGVVGDHVLVFDGKKSFVGVPNFAYDGTVPITLEAIVIPASYDEEMTVLGNLDRDPNSSSRRRGLRIGTDYRYWTLDLYAKSSVTSYYASFRQARGHDYLTIGKRVHVAGVFAGQEMRMFVDGQLTDSENSVRIHVPSLLPFLVGADPVKPTAVDPLTTRRHFDGVIESVRISNIPRYTQEKFTPPEKLTLDRNTLLLLEFNQGKGDTVPNAAAPKHQAKIVDAKWVERKQWEQMLKARIPPERPSFPRRPRRGPD